MKIINAKTLSEMITESEIGTTIDFASEFDEGYFCWWYGIKKIEVLEAICYVIGFYGGGDTELFDTSLEYGNEFDAVENFIKNYFKKTMISDEIYLDNDSEIC